jgi:hypothetical protein
MNNLNVGTVFEWISIPNLSETNIKKYVVVNIENYNIHVIDIDSKENLIFGSLNSFSEDIKNNKINIIYKPRQKRNVSKKLKTDVKADSSKKRTICPSCCHSDGVECFSDDSWHCWRCGESFEP